MSDTPREAVAGWPASAGQRLAAFQGFLAAQGDPVLAARDAEALDAFSLAEPDAFWRALWAFTELPGDPGAGPKQRRHHGRHALLSRRPSQFYGGTPARAR